MIRSMTGFARQEIKQNWGNAAWELRSVNQRYLEIVIRLPEQFRSLEPIIRERLRARMTRGKIECYLRFDADNTISHELILNEDLAYQLIHAANTIKIHSNEGTINPIDILHWPGVMMAKEQNLDEITQTLMLTFEQTLDHFMRSREQEGAALKQLIEQRLALVSEQVSQVRAAMPAILQWQREKLLSKFEDVDLQVDPTRLEQELIFIAQRIDIAEELDRLDTHVKEAYKTLCRPEAVGRRLDFMMQEFNRESNTLASKSINSDITASAIELKVLIEQMREQIQNIE